MTSKDPVHLRRYRRRVVTLASVAFLVIFALGAAITIPRIQNDLEDRVEDELAANDIEGVTASFSGQEGTLVCSRPIDAVDQAVRIGTDVRGVRSISVDATCVAGDLAEDATTTAASNTDATTIDPSTSDDTESEEVSASTTTPDDVDDLATIVQVLSGEPLFDQLWDLVEDAGLDTDDLLGAPGPITLFAPTDDAFDDAFDTLGADTFGAMTTDQELVRSLLRQHIADGIHSSDTFADGPIEMLDGSTVEIDPDIPTFSSAGSTVGVADPDTQLDIRASNGIVHAVDGILLPAEFPVPSDTVPVDAEPGPEVVATEVDYADGRAILTGPVSSDEQRVQLRSAAETNVLPENVVDDLTVIADGPTATDVDDLAVAVEAMVGNLVSGRVGLDDGDLSLVGVPLDADASVAIEESASSTGFAVELSARPIADAETAAALQDELNEFVRANPIEFVPGTLDLTPESLPIIDQAAARSLRLQGIDIVVAAFTDTGGSTESNQFFSRERASLVRDIFVARGVPDDSITSAGFGESSPILGPDGTENAAASRRIEFEVTSRSL